MSETIECHLHGEQERAYVCTHLAGSSANLGFNYNIESDSKLPDAWCDNCEIIREAHNGWDEESEKLASISILCADCYRDTRIRNTHPSIPYESLAALRWKCGSCDEWHTGVCLDFGYDRPYYWKQEYEGTGSHLDGNYCSVNDEHFFVRGVIELPIIGSDEVFRWGVWGSLSKDNFDRLRSLKEDGDYSGITPMFAWLSNKIEGYPDTLSLKMHARIKDRKDRVTFELEPSEHPLSQEQSQGIDPAKVKDITVNGLGGPPNLPHQ